MRKMMLAAIMAASALVPAAAFAQDVDRHPDRGQGQHHGDGGNGGERPQRQSQPQPQPQAQAAPQQRAERPQFQPRGPMQGQAQGDFRGRARGQAGGQGGFRNFDRGQYGGNFRGQQAQPPVAQSQGQQIDPRQDRRGDFRGGNRQDIGNGQSGQSFDRGHAFDRGQVGNRGYDGNRGTVAGRGYDRRGDGGRGYNGGHNWNRDWRQDRRYDWSRRRAENRELFRLPRYYAPSGWGYGYRRFSIGFRLSQILFQENYWIDDPYAYDLPPAYGPYRWVRYYNDALLVDMDSGEVVDTVYDIFW
ncbi:MAG: RcnB family protein [Sphingomonas sp.]